MNREEYAENFFKIIEDNTDFKVAVYPEVNPDGIALFTKRFNLPFSFIGVNFKTEDYDLQALNGGRWARSMEDFNQSTLNMASILTLYDVSRWAIENNIKDDIVTLDFRTGKPEIIIIPASEFKTLVKTLKKEYL